MRLRTRLTAAFTGVTAIALVASFAVAYVFVDRGVLRPLGTHRMLLYAVPRTGVDQDLKFLVRIFAGLFAATTLVTWLVARALARSLVRDVDAIYEVADAVATGKLDARVGGRAK